MKRYDILIIESSVHMTYQKLFRIEFGNKTFEVFLESNNRKTFLEVKDGGYLYLNLEDFNTLNETFNQHYSNVYFSVPKFSINKECIRLVSGALVTLTIMSNLTPHAYAMQNYKVEEKEGKVYITAEEQITKNVVFTSVEDLNQSLSLHEISLIDVEQAISQNENISSYYKMLLNNLLRGILKEDPHYNLRSFYERVRDLKIIEMPIKDFQAHFNNHAGGVYFSDKNECWFASEANLPLIYHELGHFAHDYKITQNGIKYERASDYSYGLNEAMNNYMIRNIIKSEGYEVQGRLLQFLLTCTNFSMHDYHDKGINGLINQLSKEYPDIDMNYIVQYANGMSDALIKQGKTITLDNNTYLLDELFQMCISRKVKDKEDVYQRFYDFTVLFMGVRNDTLVYDYLERFNDYLRTQNFSDDQLIHSKDLKAKFNRYKNVIGITNIDALPIVEVLDEENQLRVLDGDQIKVIPSQGYQTFFDFSSYISATSIEFQKSFGTNKYWKDMLLKTELVGKSKLGDIPIYINDDQLLGNYNISNLIVRMGFSSHYEIGFILSDINGNVLYQTFDTFIDTSNPISLNYYSFMLGDQINKMNLKEIFHIEYLKRFQMVNHAFLGIDVIDNNLILTSTLKDAFIEENRSHSK